jgi:hypothetical protein
VNFEVIKHETYAQRNDLAEALKPLACLLVVLGRQIQNVRIGQDQLDRVGLRAAIALSTARKVFAALTLN